MNNSRWNLVTWLDEWFDLEKALWEQDITVEVVEEKLFQALSCNSNSGWGCWRSGSCGASSCRQTTETSSV